MAMELPPWLVAALLVLTGAAMGIFAAVLGRRGRLSYLGGLQESRTSSPTGAHACTSRTTHPASQRSAPHTRRAYAGGSHSCRVPATAGIPARVGHRPQHLVPGFRSWRAHGVAGFSGCGSWM